MKFQDAFLKLLSSIAIGSKESAMNSQRFWSSSENYIYVTDPNAFNENLENIFLIDERISSRFDRKKIYQFIEKKLLEAKRNKETFEKDFDVFFSGFLEIKPKNLVVNSPISGIRLDNNARKFELYGYSFGYMVDLPMSLSDTKGMFISVTIENIYDPEVAIVKAEAAFTDFIRLIVFISGMLDKSIHISLGLPLSPDLSHEQMYVSTSSFHVTDSNGTLLSGNISNKHVTKVPVNNAFFSENVDFKKLWKLLQYKNNSKKMNDMESRMLNSALTLGESSINKDRRSSIIYTCMAMEIMFSHDELGFFQRSIGEKLSDIFVFIVATDKESRIDTAQKFKKVYRMRSAIVHGGDKQLTDDNLLINILLRAAIAQLLNNDKFSKLKNIGAVYEMLRDAQYSY